MKARHAFHLAATLVILGIFTSCTPNGGLIYSTIETEKKVVESKLPKTLTVFDLANTGSTTLPPYYVAAGALYNGTLPVGGTIGWPTAGATPAPIDPPEPKALINALAFFSGELWGGFISEGSVLGLYKSASPSFYGIPPVSDTAVLGKQVTYLQTLGANLFVVVAQVVATDNNFDMYSFNGATWSPVLVGRPASDEVKPITGIGYDGTTYWVTSGANVYSGTAFPLSTTPSASPSTPLVASLSIGVAESLNAVFTDTARNRVFIAAKLGGIYYKDGSAPWANIAAVVVNSATVSNLAIAGPTDSSATSPAIPSTYLVGTDGYGYYTLSVAANPMTLTRFSDNTIGLFNSAVRRILVDSTPAGGATVFMGTAGNGLWRTTFDKNTGALEAGSTWVHE